MKRNVPIDIDAIVCRKAIPDPTLNDVGLYEQELRKRLCGRANACGLKDYVSANKTEFVALREHLNTLPDPDPETERRIAALRKLYRVGKVDFQAKDCWQSGDALIAHEAPKDAPIVTTNKKHYEPIAAHLGKTLVS